MIKSKIKIHDKFSIVIDITYDKIFKRKKSKYTTITYLFFPNSLNVNHKTYPSTKFYNDVRLFIKYDTPNYNLSDINIGERSLLQNLTKNTRKFIKNRSEKNRSRFKDQVKMFAATFCSLLREETYLLIRAKELSANKIDAYLGKNTLILSDFRELVEIINNSSIKDKDKDVVFYADEHISNVMEVQLMKLYNHLKNKKKSDEKLTAVVKLIDGEQNYKKEKVYDSPKDKNINPEDLLYKRNQLKKYIESVFFLNQEIRKDGAVFEQSILALAAGLAMVFSTGKMALHIQETG
ncbi:MAG: hypothetical protein DRI54_03725 [Bacteroidetes bacterium]|nr:MAG: hypothetical protein DRI54_03725 [Bacteroidota bacterium]